MFIAVGGSNEVLVELLRAKGADVNAKASLGGTPLQRALRLGHRDVVELLIAKGADVSVKAVNGQTPLSLAGRQGHKEMAEMLRQHGAKE